NNPGWDLINASSLIISSTSGSKFNVKLTSLNGAVAGNAANFNGGQDYDLVVVHTTSGISGNGVSALNLDASTFSNTLDANGQLSLVIVGNDLVLQYRRAAAISSGPNPQTVSTGNTANFSVSATGSSLGYQWKKGGVNLTDGTQGSGAVVTGAGSANLTV